MQKGALNKGAVRKAFETNSGLLLLSLSGSAHSGYGNEKYGLSIKKLIYRLNNCPIEQLQALIG